ncbi:hypothetical protein PGT21_032996 [Puccinia graminis f. sp. tritici]|uniref:Uncharacterized protein n=1 Tax=Puccinia graminis f. sp. tritici TaxID=56615 RepID=A0A5B0NQF2_PUCGR|nr:hypothetical protein PGT21_032996 [Puccinia graminis f. sp. tritici]
MHSQSIVYRITEDQNNYYLSNLDRKRKILPTEATWAASACSISCKTASNFSARVSRITGLSSISPIHIGRLLLSVELGWLGKICVRRASSFLLKTYFFLFSAIRKKHYLSKKLLDLRTQILPNRPSSTDMSRRPMWIGEIEDDPVIRETLAEKLEAALREIEQADTACSREWALKFIVKWTPVEDPGDSSTRAPHRAAAEPVPVLGSASKLPSRSALDYTTREQNHLKTAQDSDSTPPTAPLECSVVIFQTLQRRTFFERVMIQSYFRGPQS